METRKIVKLDPQLSENEHKFRRPQNRGTLRAVGGSGPQHFSPQIETNGISSLVHTTIMQFH